MQIPSAVVCLFNHVLDTSGSLQSDGSKLSVLLAFICNSKVKKFLGQKNII